MGAKLELVLLKIIMKLRNKLCCWFREFWITKRKGPENQVTEVQYNHTYESPYNFMSPHTTIWGPIQLYEAPYTFMRPHTTLWVPIQLYEAPYNFMRPHTTTVYEAPYNFMSPHTTLWGPIQLYEAPYSYMRPHIAIWGLKSKLSTSLLRLLSPLNFSFSGKLLNILGPT